jgi:hypothetical protein
MNSPYSTTGNVPHEWCVPAEIANPAPALRVSNTDVAYNMNLHYVGVKTVAEILSDRDENRPQTNNRMNCPIGSASLSDGAAVSRAFTWIVWRLAMHDYLTIGHD